MTPEIAATLVRGTLTVTDAGCWQTSSTTPTGYGNARFSGRFRTGTQTLAHRAVWIAARGLVPAGCEIDPLCRNRACVNPDHLEAVDHFTNMARADIRRLTFGDGDQRNRLRHARLAARKTQTEVAQALGVTQVQVSRWETERHPIDPVDEARLISALAGAA